jgi:hypothetical protein
VTARAAKTGRVCAQLMLPDFVIPTIKPTFAPTVTFGKESSYKPNPKSLQILTNLTDGKFTMPMMINPFTPHSASFLS